MQERSPRRCLILHVIGVVVERGAAAAGDRRRTAGGSAPRGRFRADHQRVGGERDVAGVVRAEAGCEGAVGKRRRRVKEEGEQDAECDDDRLGRQQPWPPGDSHLGGATALGSECPSDQTHSPALMHACSLCCPSSLTGVSARQRSTGTRQDVRAANDSVAEAPPELRPANAAHSTNGTRSTPFALMPFPSRANCSRGPARHIPTTPAPRTPSSPQPRSRLLQHARRTHTHHQ
jgi:hypothetical protein